MPALVARYRRRGWLARAGSAQSRPHPKSHAARSEATRVANHGRNQCPRPHVLGIVFPGFHRDAINDRLWGEGYTEWWRVQNATPVFPGHVQPRVPLHAHYYDLSERRELGRMADQAHTSGIDSLLMYEYWFRGERFLRGPLDTLLASPSIKTSFALCYADIALIKKHVGVDYSNSSSKMMGDVLVPRVHTPADDAAHARWLGHHVFSDPRYLRIGGRPVYALFRHDWRAADKTAAETTLREAVHVPTLRGELRRCCDEDLYIIEYVDVQAGAHYAELSQARGLGADAILAWGTPFQLMHATMKRGRPIGRAYIAGGTEVADYKDYAGVYVELLAQMMSPAVLQKYDVVPCVMPGWDNTPRYPSGGSVLANSTPGRFGALMSAALRLHCSARSAARAPPGDASAKTGGALASPGFVSVNALNEWGEGCYLEPDHEHHYGYYRALHDALQEVGRSSFMPMG